MRIITRKKEMQAYSLSVKKKGDTIGFVPTMGYLHEGHMSLVRQSKKDADKTVVSIFVNPLQFGRGEDFSRYPQNVKRDVQACAKAGADVLFYPSCKEMYPHAHYTYVEVTSLDKDLCGASRPGHFRGVATVVMKLFHIVLPDTAFFGQKDAQQSVIVKKMVEDLDMPIKIKIMPIVREKDGLAMSSRNIYLSPRQRKDALVLYHALQQAKTMIKSTDLSFGEVRVRAKALLCALPSVKLDYFEIVDPKTLAPLQEKRDRDVLILGAIKVGKTRLIDNLTL